MLDIVYNSLYVVVVFFFLQNVALLNLYMKYLKIMKQLNQSKTVLMHLLRRVLRCVFLKLDYDNFV